MNEDDNFYNSAQALAAYFGFLERAYMQEVEAYRCFQDIAKIKSGQITPLSNANAIQEADTYSWYALFEAEFYLDAAMQRMGDAVNHKQIQLGPIPLGTRTA